MSVVVHAKTKTKKCTWLYYNGASNEELCLRVTGEMSYLAALSGQRVLCKEPGAAKETLSVIIQKVHFFFHLSHDLFITGKIFHINHS